MGRNPVRLLKQYTLAPPQLLFSRLSLESAARCLRRTPSPSLHSTNACSPTHTLRTLKTQGREEKWVGGWGFQGSGGLRRKKKNSTVLSNVLPLLFEVGGKKQDPPPLSFIGSFYFLVVSQSVHPLSLSRCVASCPLDFCSARQG